MTEPTKRPSLYERTTAMLALEAMIREADGDITPEMEARYEAEIAGRAERLDACAAVRAEYLALAEWRKQEAERVSALAAEAQREADRIERYMLEQMARAGEVEHVSERWRLRRVANPPKVVAVTRDAPALRMELDELPEPLRACVKVTPPTPESYAWDKAALLKLHKTNPDAAAEVCVIDRGERLKVV